MIYIEVDTPMPPEMYARYLVIPLYPLELGFAWAAVGFAVEISFLMYKNAIVHHLEKTRRSIDIETTDKFDHKKESRDEWAKYTQNYLSLTAIACMCIGIGMIMMVDRTDRCGYGCIEPWLLNGVAWIVVGVGCMFILNAQEFIIEGHHAFGRSLGLVAILWILLNFIGLILLAFISTQNLMGYPDFVSKELLVELKLFILYEIIITTLMLLGGANLLVHCRLRHQKRNCDAVGATTKDALPSYYHNYI